MALVIDLGRPPGLPLTPGLNRLELPVIGLFSGAAWGLFLLVVMRLSSAGSVCSAVALELNPHGERPHVRSLFAQQRRQFPPAAAILRQQLPRLP
jgi:hypothetical protein